jgi:ornithine cyclodeaminase/alanine dehydrogenase-like protein (mu-crystallin family)
MKPEILFLKQEDVIAAGLLDMGNILKMVEKTFYMDGKGLVKNPVKTVVSIPEDNDKWESHFISMPVYIGGEVNRPGVKWAAESAANMKTGDIPMGIDMVILSDPVTVLPVAIMDGTLITAMRTAAAAGVAAKYLAPKKAEVVGCVGAGVIGRTMIMALREVLPNLKQIRMCDLNLQKAENLAAEFEGIVDVKPTNSVEEAVKDADVIATMTTSRKPFVKTEWVKPGAMVIQMSGYEVESGVVRKADKIVVDSWAQMKENTQSVFHELLQSGDMSDNDVSLLKEVVAGAKPGRESEEEMTFFGSRGMGCLDIMVANYIFDQAEQKGLGQKLVLWDEPKWI